MVDATKTSQITPTSPEPALPQAEPPIPPAAKINSGKLRLELGVDYLLWGITEKRYFGNPKILTGAYTDAHLIDLNVLSSYFDEMMASSDLHYGEVDLFLSLPDAMLRSLYVPVVPKDELKQVVLWEAGKVFPFGLQGELFAWRIVNTVEWSGNRKYQVQVAAVPSARVTPICELLAAKGLSVKRVTLTALDWEPVIRDLAAKAQKSTPCCAAVVRLLGNRLSVFCFHEGVLEFVRENTVESQEEGGDFEASLRYFDGSAPVPLLDVTQEFTFDSETVARTVLDNLDYYYGRFTQRSITNVILVTSPPGSKALSEALQETLGVTVHPAYNDSAVMTATQMASRRLLAPVQQKMLHRSKQLDLLPAQFRIAAQQRTHFKFATYAAALTMTAALLVSLFQFIVLGSLIGEEAQLQGTLDGIRNSQPYQEIAAQMGEQTQWQAQLSQLRKSSSEHSRILKAISLLTPSDIFLTSLNLQTAQNAAGKPVDLVSVGGFVSDNGRILELRLAEYLKALATSPYCNRIELTNQNTSVSDQGKRLTFSITMEFGS